MKLTYFLMVLLSSAFLALTYFHFQNFNYDPEIDGFMTALIPGVLLASIINAFLKNEKKMEVNQNQEIDKRVKNFTKYSLKSLFWAESAILIAIMAYAYVGKDLYLIYSAIGLLILLLQYPSDQKITKLLSTAD